MGCLYCTQALAEAFERDMLGKTGKTIFSVLSREPLRMCGLARAKDNGRIATSRKGGLCKAA